MTFSDTTIWGSTALILTWIIYRLGVFSERKNILESVSKELELHSYWMAREYKDGIFVDESWKQLGYIVFKLSSVAIDNAISRGPTVFLNPKLLQALVGYRQMISQFNQLVENASNFQSSTELWNSNADEHLIHRMNELTATIHWYGIGTREKPLGHYYYSEVFKNLEIEKGLKLIAYIWFLFNINSIQLKKLLCDSL